QLSQEPVPAGAEPLPEVAARDHSRFAQARKDDQEDDRVGEEGDEEDIDPSAREGDDRREAGDEEAPGPQDERAEEVAVRLVVVESEDEPEGERQGGVREQVGT